MIKKTPCASLCIKKKFTHGVSIYANYQNLYQAIATSWALLQIL